LVSCAELADLVRDKRLSLYAAMSPPAASSLVAAGSAISAASSELPVIRRSWPPFTSSTGNIRTLEARPRPRGPACVIAAVLDLIFTALGLFEGPLPRGRKQLRRRVNVYPWLVIDLAWGVIGLAF
jgi:hypothetical protein